MDAIKRILGIVWLALAGFAAYFSIAIMGLPKVASEVLDDKVFGIIILFVLTPIIVGGLGIFGYYCLTGEYNADRMEAAPEE